MDKVNSMKYNNSVYAVDPLLVRASSLMDEYALDKKQEYLNTAENCITSVEGTVKKGTRNETMLMTLKKRLDGLKGQG